MEVENVSEEQPRIENQLNEKLQRIEPPSSPPPNCAICLGSCVNKCFTDRCLHQFCFDCLLEWSKRKPVCPLCKQPFKSIIHNIKSNTDYEEHIIPQQPEYIIEDIPEDEDPFNNFYLPNGPRPQRHFQFRTTLTLDPDGEVAIQQLLLSHPSITNSLFLPGLNGFNRNPQQTLGFRRAVYRNGWWAQPTSDVTGRYRESFPNFYRDNLVQMHRIIPWLTRELSAIIDNYDYNIYVAQQTIIESLCEVPVESRDFKDRIRNYLRDYTDHFIHEFINFLRAPYDMIGYDQHVRYSLRQPEHTNSISDSDDSDVRVVDSPNDCIYVEPRTPEVIVIHSDNSDSDVIYRTPTPPVVVDLVNTTDEETPTTTNNTESTCTETRSPLKIRLKLMNQTRKKRYSKRKYKQSSESEDSSKKNWSVKQRSRSSSSSSSSSRSSSTSSSPSRTSSDTSDWTPVKSESKYMQTIVLKRKAKRKDKNRRKNKYDINRFVIKPNESKPKPHSDETKSSDNSDSEYYSRQKKGTRTKRKKTKSRKNQKLDKRRHKKFPADKKLKLEVNSDSDIPNNSNPDYNRYDINNDTFKEPEPLVKQPELRGSIPLSALEGITLNKPEHNSDYNYTDTPGPSTSKLLPSVIVKGNKTWYSRPDLDSTTDSD